MQAFNLIIKRLRGKWLFKKRVIVTFITNFPFLNSNIPSSPACGVFNSQLVRYVRVCSSYECLILRAVRLSNKLLGYEYDNERLKSSLRKFYGCTGILSNNMKSPIMTWHYSNTICSELLLWSDITPIGDHVTELDVNVIIEFDFLPNLVNFLKTFVTDAACRQRTPGPIPRWDLYML